MPPGLKWGVILKKAGELLPYAFEMSDAQVERPSRQPSGSLPPLAGRNGGRDETRS